jgi:hypothetical protein
MSFLLAYLLFATTTAIMSLYEVFVPIITLLEDIQPDNLLSRSKWLSLATFGTMAFGIAPLLFPILIVPQWSEWFKNAALETMMD